MSRKLRAPRRVRSRTTAATPKSAPSASTPHVSTVLARGGKKRLLKRLEQSSRYLERFHSAYMSSVTFLPDQRQLDSLGLLKDDDIAAVAPLGLTPTHGKPSRARRSAPSPYWHRVNDLLTSSRPSNEATQRRSSSKPISPTARTQFLEPPPQNLPYK